MFKYTPLYSFLKYINIKYTGKLEFKSGNLGGEIEVRRYGNYTIFKEIYLSSKENTPKQGKAIFQVVFHDPKMNPEKIIKHTDYTIPFFVGLPGFCNKQFMVNKQTNMFSGRYEWETVGLAKKYARSYAVNFMAKRSKPYPLYYKITDSVNGEIIEEIQL